jgi:uncharacterized membrane protein
MRVLAYGFWGTSHWVLDVIGRGAACVLPRKASQRDDVACAIAGGAVLGVIFGAIFGFMLSEESRDLSAIAGAALGCLLGACTGAIYGAIVEVVDDEITAFLKSLHWK